MSKKSTSLAGSSNKVKRSRTKAFKKKKTKKVLSDELDQNAPARRGESGSSQKTIRSMKSMKSNRSMRSRKSMNSARSNKSIRSNRSR